MNVPRGITWPYALIALLAVAAVAIGVVRPQLVSAATGGSAKKKPGVAALIKQNPPPTLFTDAEIATVGKQVAAQRKKADALFAQWKKAHGTTRDDKAFAAFAAQQVPAPPSAAQRAAELRADQRLAKTRTAAGKMAATWLELHGKKDIWKLYLHDQRELIPAAQGTAEKGRAQKAV
ncbi:hypothetical protein ACGFX8_36895 [Streptomyces sp. NPDC048362]|uniref:hypothetical protein n=1 Tax=Streptomyces sp. NPDC048362 TaxID=3365539 RepID=UPI003714D21F